VEGGDGASRGGNKSSESSIVNSYADKRASESRATLLFLEELRERVGFAGFLAVVECREVGSECEWERDDGAVRRICITSPAPTSSSKSSGIACKRRPLTSLTGEDTPLEDAEEGRWERVLRARAERGARLREGRWRKLSFEKTVYLDQYG
jgi:hypothetical protein